MKGIIIQFMDGYELQLDHGENIVIFSFKKSLDLEVL